MQIFIAANNSPGKGEVVGLVNRDWCRAGDCLADIQLNARTSFVRHLRWNGARIALDEAQLNGHGSEISMFVFCPLLLVVSRGTPCAIVVLQPIFQERRELDSLRRTNTVESNASSRQVKCNCNKLS
jgi:hypothetical protein